MARVSREKGGTRRQDDSKGQLGDRRHDNGDGRHVDGRQDNGKGQKEAAAPPENLDLFKLINSI
jgi:hypothetical protein